MAELTGKAISELPESTTVNDAALVALSENGASKKMTLATLVGNRLKKTGDTMTGNLTLSGGNVGVYEDTTAFEIGVPPANDTYTIGLRNRDKNGTLFSTFNSFLYVNGQIGARIMTQRSNVTNQLRLIIDSNGNQIVSVSDRGAWRKALGLCYAANDTFSNTASSLVLNGCIDGNKRNLYFNFITEKSVENISTIAVTTMTGSIQGATGVIVSGGTNFVNPPTYTVTCTKQGTHHIRINLQTSTALSSAVANSPVIYFGSLALKFT